MHRCARGGWGLAMVAAIACVSAGAANAVGEAPAHAERTKVRPGITVLLQDSLKLIAGKRVGLLTNETGVDERGRSDIDLLAALPARDGAGAPRLVALFSPEHGIRGAVDHTNVADGRDPRTGIPIYSLYGETVLPPPDSIMDRLDALIVDLQDLGARPWTYVASMVYAVRSAAEHHIPVLVLDRPNPITGEHVEGPVLDSTVAYAGSDAPARRARPTALYPIPMRHGLTMGELARYYNDVLGIHADLHVIPMTGWRRSMWFDQTGLPWVRPSPNMPSMASATLYPGLVWLESTNVSVGRGTDRPFQLLGAPWLDARRVIALLADRELRGVRFETATFTPRHPTDGKYGGVRIRGIRVIITDRDRIQTSRLGATVLWAIGRVAPDSLHIRPESFDLLFGVPSARDALLSGADPDSIIDAGLPATVAFQEQTRRYRLYR